MPAPRPKIAHVDAESGFSGGEKQVFLLIEGLRRDGWESVLFSPPGSRSQARAAELGIEHVGVAMRNDLDGPAVLALKRGFERTGVALAHLHTGRATWLGGWAARMAAIPAITTRRMDRDVKRGLRTKLVYGTLTRRAVAISPAVADCLRAGGVPEERIRVIWSTVDPDELRPRRGREQVRADLGCPEDRVVLLAVGALVERKGYGVLLAALADLLGPQAAQEGPRPSWTCWIAGAGPDRERLEQQLRVLSKLDDVSLGRNVRFLGHRDDVADLLNACDVFVMPSLREGLGVAALEAMAAGRPVVASNVGGLGEIVRHRETGLLVPPRDDAALAGALDSLIRDVAWRASLGAAGHRRIESSFLPSRMTADYTELYREVLAEAAR